MASNNGEAKKDDGLTAVVVMIASFCMILWLLWNAKSVQIISFWTPRLVSLADIWLWLPGDRGVASYMKATHMAEVFLQNPKKVSILEWFSFYNLTAFIPSLCVSLLVAGYFVRIIFTEVESVKRGFKPQQLAAHLSHVFTGIAPVLHLRKNIALGKEPYWRRQLFPHEALLNEKVAGKPLIMDGKVVIERVEQYFKGIIMKKVPKTDANPAGLEPELIGGRFISKMLGRQVVDLLSDRQKIPCFPDRFSNIGKIIYGLLCAHAFGGDEGKKDYAKARDQLNNSARGAAHGFANLKVAEWIFEKYRMNKTAAKLFAIHHWEYTYLYELLIQAKRQGKCGHWEFIWLKPMNRILFYTQNTVGRLTPHTESAATYAQYIFERRVAKAGRLPLRLNANGAYNHVIYVEKSVKGLALEWDRWSEGVDDEDLWWKDASVWKKLSGAKIDLPPAPPKELSVETNFDSMMSAQARELELKQAEELAAAVEANNDSRFNNVNF